MANKYFNREMSQLEFFLRVLEEAMDERHPLLERIKFLSIFHNTLDEFFMIRASGLVEQVEAGLSEQSEDGLTATEQLRLIRERSTVLTEIAYRFFHETLQTRLAQNNIVIYNYNELTSGQKASLDAYFDEKVYPVLTPLAVDPGHPFPHISNLSLNLAIVVCDAQGEEHFARLKIPTGAILPRFVPVPLEEADDKIALTAPLDGNVGDSKFGFVWLEQLVTANLSKLFEGVDVCQTYPFRVIRDADLEIREDEAGDLLQTIETSLQRRGFGAVVNLTVNSSMPDQIKNLLIDNLEITPNEVYPVVGLLGLSDLIELNDLDLPALKDPPFKPHVPIVLRNSQNIFNAIRAQDILLHHPYDSFAPVIDFIKTAADDPDVLAIKQTIYRVGSHSPVVEELAKAAVNGKQVSTLVELKARFDEENNIEWARALEKAGVHVVYGSIELKTHCKVLLVVRKEPDGIRRYVHLSTGNYNVKTARGYTDLGFFTCNPDIGADASMLFNSLTGYSYQPKFRKLLVSPHGVREGLFQRIKREIEHAQAGRPAHIIFKINALVDFASVDMLYKASQAGVKVDLVVRTLCCLRPGVPGLSENIRVTSIVGRNLEHSRIYYFCNGGGNQQEIYLGSADLMQRNLDRRVETLFPIENAALKEHLYTNILQPYLRDNQKARVLLPDGRYDRVMPDTGEAAFDAQNWFSTHFNEVEPHLPLAQPAVALR